MRRFDSRRQFDTESLVEYETALRIMYKRRGLMRRLINATQRSNVVLRMESARPSYRSTCDYITAASISHKLLSKHGYMRQRWTVLSQRRLYVLLR